MIVERLQIENFRNLERVELSPHPRCNIFCGPNGAGKTSILETLVVLSRGRSFRTKHARDLIGHEHGSFGVFCQGIREDGTHARLGLSRAGSHWKARMDGADLQRFSDLTRALPLVLVEPNSHLLVGGTPEYRRKYLDWGMFHVEHGFLENWKQFSRALKQRNAALRRGNSEILDSIDPVLARHGAKLDEHRQRFSEQVAAKLDLIAEQLMPNSCDLSIEYEKGWSGGEYIEALTTNRVRDLEQSTTGAGPHRADLSLKCGGRPARAMLSRGEQKMLTCALLLTECEILAGTGEKPLLLLDDLISEFDPDNFGKVMRRALDTGCQVWVTGTVPIEPRGGHAVFHVEQGVAGKVVQ